MPPSSDIAVSVRGLSKAYTIAHNDGESHVTLAEQILSRLKNPFKRTTTETFHALKDVEFDIKKGDVVGIIGRNGAGKSTLLKILSRITEPTAGEIRLYGRVGSLLEVGTGFHPELTGRENIYLNGQILGMRKREIDKQFDAIVDFAEVEKFLDTPVKRYSSGMYVRLAFAVAAHLNPEILIVDEVLAVGDAQFQKKCLGKMEEVSSQQGRTVLFVSHNLGVVRSLCRTGIVLSSGNLAFVGHAHDAVSTYLKNADYRGTATAEFDHPPTASAWMTGATLRSGHDATSTIEIGDSIAIEVAFASTSPILPKVGFVVTSAAGERVLNANNHYQATVGNSPKTSQGIVRCDLGRVPLMPGHYIVSLWFGDERGDQHQVDGALRFEVVSRDIWGTGRVPPNGTSLMWWPTRFEPQELRLPVVSGICAPN